MKNRSNSGNQRWALDVQRVKWDLSPSDTSPTESQSRDVPTSSVPVPSVPEPSVPVPVLWDSLGHKSQVPGRLREIRPSPKRPKEISPKTLILIESLLELSSELNCQLSKKLSKQK